MQLIKSLFCWHGFDNRQRFIIICIVCFITFIISNESFARVNIASITILLLLVATCLASTQRRLNDAQLIKNWLFAPAGSFFSTGLLIIFIDHSASYWLLALPLLLSLLLLTYPSKAQKRYIFGYSGPVNLSQYCQITKTKSRNNQRVEPTLNSIHETQSAHEHMQYSSYSNNTGTPTTQHIQTHSGDNLNDIGETIRLALFSHKNARLTLLIIATLVTLVVLISITFNSPNESTPQKPLIINDNNINEYANKLALEDNFSIMSSTHNTMVIHWQANVLNSDNVWLLETAIGDKSCKAITFNNGDEIRTFRVTSKNNAYFAYFSPIDTKLLIQNIAFKNSFSLCGFNFSLKGSQATLGKSPFYADYINY